MTTPIITCGDSQPDATRVAPGMKPEFDVIYAGFSLPETYNEVPQILAGSSPSASSLHTHIGSNDFSLRPVAVVVGGGYNDDAYNKLRDLSIKASGSKQALGVAFFRADNELTDRLVREGKGPEKRTPGYAEAVTKRLKDRMAEVGVHHGLKEQDVGELFWY